MLGNVRQAVPNKDLGVFRALGDPIMGPADNRRRIIDLLDFFGVFMSHDTNEYQHCRNKHREHDLVMQSSGIPLPGIGRLSDAHDESSWKKGLVLCQRAN